MAELSRIVGDKKREAIDALKGYVYQLYQSAIAWTELKESELLILEVAEDYATVAGNVLHAVQIKNVNATTTINTDGVVSAIDSLISLKQQNPEFDISVRYLSTSAIGLEKKLEDRVLRSSTLEAWKRLAKSGDSKDLRRVLQNSKITATTKTYISELDDDQFREQVLRKLHFDCGVSQTQTLRKILQTKLSSLINREGGTFSQVMNAETSVLFRLLEVCTTHEDRCLNKNDLKGIVEQVTRVSISQAAFDLQNKFFSSVIPTLVSSSNLATVHNYTSIRTVPRLPNACVPRIELVQMGQQVLKKYGLVWLYGTTGIGKTLLARTIAFQNNGVWSGTSLRGIDPLSLPIILEGIANELSSIAPAGLIIDDLEDTTDQAVTDAVQYLMLTADRLSIPVIITSVSAASSRMCFTLNAKEDVSIRISAFEEHEIGMILGIYGGDTKLWTRYVHLASGGGHPQLVQALVQNLRNREWPIDEIRTFASILEKNPAIEEVRTECRKRLLRELPKESLMLLQRLSLHIGRFSKRLAVDIASTSQKIENAGFLFDDLVGPWISQIDTEYYQLSPLLSGLASESLSKLQQKSVYHAIADSLTHEKTLNASDMYSAVPSAILSQNERAIIRFCYATLQSSVEDLKLIAEHLDVLCYLSPEDPPFPNNPSLNQIFRGVQLIICLHSRISSKNIDKILARFQSESLLIEDERIRIGTEFLIYVKILISNPKGLTFRNFAILVEYLFSIIRADGLEGIDTQIKQTFLKHTEDILLGFSLILRLTTMSKINDLIVVFEFIDNVDLELRKELLLPLSKPEFNADMFLASAWLSEDSAGTIHGSNYAQVFDKLERISANWPIQDIAISCCVYRAIILDEYDQQTEEALRVLNAGLDHYDPTNSVLLRAKAKVLYRSDNYQESLEISRNLIENNLIRSAVECAFLGRDAAISAERQSDYHTARKYYLYARQAAQKAAFGNMIPMATGLLADAALAAWHTGDRETCLTDFVILLEELQEMNSSDSINAAHVRAISNHVLLWLDQDATEQNHFLEDGSKIQIYPGCVSNPSPHKDIAKKEISSIGFSWYMLAKIECEIDLECSITKNLDKYLPKGRSLEGESILNQALQRKFLVRLNGEEFQNVLISVLAEHIYYQTNGGIHNVFNLKDLTVGTFPTPKTEQLLECDSIAQIYTLVFCGFCLVKGSIDTLDRYISQIGSKNRPPFEQKFLRCLRTGEQGNGFNENFASLIANERKRIIANHAENPALICLFAINLVSLASPIGLFHCLSRPILNWYENYWRRILANQRFRLVNPALYVDDIDTLLNTDIIDPIEKLTNLLLLTLPATTLDGQAGAREALLSIRKKYSFQSL